MVKPGYKQTEIGVIPKAWDVVSFFNIAQIYRGGSPRPIQDYLTQSDDGVNWIKIGDVGVNEKYIRKTEEKIIPAGVSKSRKVGSGDFILSNSMSFGRPYILKINGCIHDGWLVIQNYQKTFNQDFLYYLLSSDMIYAQYKSMAAGSSVQNLNKEKVGALQVVVPQMDEQASVAEALSSADELVSTLEKLIAKKKAIKQGTMQELLTGKKRLPGFNEVWRKCKLNDVLSIGHGQAQHDIESVSGRYPILATSGVIGHTNHFLWSEPSVLIGRKGTIDKPQYMETPFWTIDTLFYTKIKEENLAKYLFYCFCLIPWNDYNEASGVPSLSAKVIENIDIHVPDYEEQMAIAEILSKMDSEIESLEQKLAKARQLKQGMMQQLLTGKIRLV